MKMSGVNPRRYVAIAGIASVIGMATGIATVAAINPVTVTSNALVVMPPQATESAVAATIPASAQPSANPVKPFTNPYRNVSINTPTPYVILINATGKTAQGAETLANTVAQSYIRYLVSLSKPGAILVSGRTATGKSLPIWLLIGALLGMASGVATGIIATAVSGRVSYARH